MDDYQFMMTIVVAVIAVFYFIRKAEKKAEEDDEEELQSSSTSSASNDIQTAQSVTGRMKRPKQPWTIKTCLRPYSPSLIVSIKQEKMMITGLHIKENTLMSHTTKILFG